MIFLILKINKISKSQFLGLASKTVKDFM